MTAEETSSSRFQPGQSGNPNGRPRGSKNKSVLLLDALGAEAAPEIVRAMIEKAKEGDAVAAKPILDRIWPLRKGARVEFTLPSIKDATELPAAIANITEQVAAGDLSPDEGALIVGLLESQRKAIETVQLVERVAALEAKLSKTR